MTTALASAHLARKASRLAASVRGLGRKAPQRPAQADQAPIEFGVLALEAVDVLGGPLLGAPRTD